MNESAPSEQQEASLRWQKIVYWLMIALLALGFILIVVRIRDSAWTGTVLAVTAALEALGSWVIGFLVIRGRIGYSLLWKNITGRTAVAYGAGYIVAGLFIPTLLALLLLHPSLLVFFIIVGVFLVAAIAAIALFYVFYFRDHAL